MNDNIISTPNKMGFNWSELDSVSLNFISKITGCPKPILDLGSGLGNFSTRLLEESHHVIANDISKESLKKLQSNLSKEHKNQLRINSNSFPHETQFSDHSLSAVYSARMIQFLKPKDLENGVKKIFNWLEINGLVCFITFTPFRGFLDSITESLSSDKAAGKVWPYEINNYHSFLSQEAKSKLPNYVNLFDKDIIEQLLKKSGFRIELVEWIPFNLGNKSYNKGMVGIIGKKTSLKE